MHHRGALAEDCITDGCADNCMAGIEKNELAYNMCSTALLSQRSLHPKKPEKDDATPFRHTNRPSDSRDSSRFSLGVPKSP